MTAPTKPAIKRRVADSWEILGVQILRFDECGHEVASFNHVCGWPRPEMFRDAILGCEQCSR